MRRVAPLALLLCGANLSAQTLPWDSQLRLGPQFFSYDIKAPINEKVSQVAFPLFVVVPVAAVIARLVGVPADLIGTASWLAATRPAKPRSTSIQPRAPPA